MPATLSWSDIALRLILAIVAGVVIGLNRGEHAQPAGLRTMVLISVAAALAMIQANLLLAETQDTRVSIVRLDMMRLPLGILSGIGFIGAGAILRRGDMVRGVTTAATLWLATVIGLCFGGGQIWLGVAGTTISFVTLWLLRYVETAILTARRGTVTVTFTTKRARDVELFAILEDRGFKVRSRRVEHDREAGLRVECSGRYQGRYPDWSSRLVQEIARHPDVSKVAWSDAE